MRVVPARGAPPKAHVVPVVPGRSYAHPGLIPAQCCSVPCVPLCHPRNVLNFTSYPCSFASRYHRLAFILQRFAVVHALCRRLKTSSGRFVPPNAVATRHAPVPKRFHRKGARTPAAQSNVVLPCRSGTRRASVPRCFSRSSAPAR